MQGRRQILPTFYLSKNRFLATGLKRDRQKTEIFSKLFFLCGVKTEKKEKPAFHRTQKRGI